MLITALVLAPLSSGTASEAVNGVAGKYVREEKYEGQSAELEIRQLPDKKAYVTGLALWGINNINGPNTGELNFVTSIDNGQLKYLKKSGKGHVYKLELQIHGKRLTAKEDGAFGYLGAGATFAGNYLKK